jgi:hypothetical protein
LAAALLFLMGLVQAEAQRMPRALQERVGFVVTNGGDTLEAMAIPLGRCFRVRRQELLADGGRRRIPLSGLKAIHWGSEIHHVMPRMLDGRKSYVIARSLLPDGRLRLLRDNHEGGFFPYYLCDGEQCRPLGRRRLSSEVWAWLMACPRFAERFGGYPQGLRRNGLVAFPRRKGLWAEMAAFYNLHCGG